MNRWVKLSLAGAVLVAAACGEQPSAPQRETQQPAAVPAANPEFAQVFAQPGNHVHVMPTQAAYAEAFARARHGGGGGGGGTGIFYHGGPIVYNPRVVAIYWSASTIYAGGPAAGTSGSGGTDGSLVGYFLRNLGGSPYWNINTTYFDGAGTHLDNVVSYDGYWADNTDVPASGASVSDAAVQAEVVKGFTSGAVTFDPSTIYVVFSANGVNLGGGFGTQYCAYHGYFTWNGNNVKYAVMPYAYEYPSACTAGQAPNGDPAADAEVNVLAHETEEFATDEDLNAWYDRRGYENADKCAWKFGTTSGGAGKQWNIVVGGKDWLVQMNWVNANSGGCVQRWP
jgi:hypothetical protein